MMTQSTTNGKTPAPSMADVTAALRLEADRVRTALQEHESRVEELEQHLKAERSRMADLRTVVQHLDNSVSYLCHQPINGRIFPVRKTIHRRGLAGANVQRSW